MYYIIITSIYVCRYYLLYYYISYCICMVNNFVMFSSIKSILNIYKYILFHVCSAGMILTLKDTGVPECVVSGPLQLVRNWIVPYDRDRAGVLNAARYSFHITLCFLTFFLNHRRTTLTPSSLSLDRWGRSSCVRASIDSAQLELDECCLIIISIMIIDECPVSRQPFDRTPKRRTQTTPWRFIKCQCLVSWNVFHLGPVVTWFFILILIWLSIFTL